MNNAVEVAETTLIKHSAAIHISNSLTLIQRKLFNVLLQRAYPTLLSEETHALPLAELKAQLGYRSKNDEPIKEGFRVLNSTQVEWNVLNKDREERWGIGTCLADAEIIGGLCEYSYSPKMRKLLGSPAVYARLNLEVQNTFRSKHALALWEFLEDALGARRREAGGEAGGQARGGEAAGARAAGACGEGEGGGQRKGKGGEEEKAEEQEDNDDNGTAKHGVRNCQRWVRKLGYRVR